jgi:Uma2 family endonuclease
MNTTLAEIDYPSSDGQPMAENTRQYDWIVKIKGNLDVMYQDDPNIFVAGDHLIYPVQGDPTIRVAPDVYVAFGRPKGHRGSYRVFEEDGIFPQVVFEVMSPGNSGPEMERKVRFYERYGADEIYIYDPDSNELTAYVRDDDGMIRQDSVIDFVSPRLGIRFDLSDDEMVLRRPDGKRFVDFLELNDAAERDRKERLISDAKSKRAERDLARAETAKAKADADKAKAEEKATQAEAKAIQAEAKATQAEAEIARLLALLKQSGIDAQ